jgi:hypothetical protein
LSVMRDQVGQLTFILNLNEAAAEWLHQGSGTETVVWAIEGGRRNEKLTHWNVNMGSLLRFGGLLMPGNGPNHPILIGTILQNTVIRINVTTSQTISSGGQLGPADWHHPLVSTKSRVAYRLVGMHPDHRSDNGEHLLAMLHTASKVFNSIKRKLVVSVETFRLGKKGTKTVRSTCKELFSKVCTKITCGFTYYIGLEAELDVRPLMSFQVGDGWVPLQGAVEGPAITSSQQLDDWLQKNFKIYSTLGTLVERLLVRSLVELELSRFMNQHFLLTGRYSCWGKLAIAPEKVDGIRGTYECDMPFLIARESLIKQESLKVNESPGDFWNKAFAMYKPIRSQDAKFCAISKAEALVVDLLHADKLHAKVSTVHVSNVTCALREYESPWRDVDANADADAADLYIIGITGSD